MQIDILETRLVEQVSSAGISFCFCPCSLGCGCCTITHRLPPPYRASIRTNRSTSIQLKNLSEPPQAAQIKSLEDENESLRAKNKSLESKLRKHTRKTRHFDISKLPDDLLTFKPLATDERVLAAIVSDGSDIPSIHKLAKAYAQSQTDENAKALRERIATLKQAYEEATTDALKREGWFRQCHC